MHTVRKRAGVDKWSASSNAHFYAEKASAAAAATARNIERGGEQPRLRVTRYVRRARFGEVGWAPRGLVQ